MTINDRHQSLGLCLNSLCNHLLHFLFLASLHDIVPVLTFSSYPTLNFTWLSLHRSTHKHSETKHFRVSLLQSWQFLSHKSRGNLTRRHRLFLPPSWHVSLVTCSPSLAIHPAYKSSLLNPDQVFHSLFRHSPVYLPDAASCSCRLMRHHFYGLLYISQHWKIKVPCFLIGRDTFCISSPAQKTKYLYKQHAASVTCRHCLLMFCHVYFSCSVTFHLTLGW